MALREMLAEKLIHKVIFATGKFQLADGTIKGQSHDDILQALRRGPVEVKECERASKKEKHAKVVCARSSESEVALLFGDTEGVGTFVVSSGSTLSSCFVQQRRCAWRRRRT